MGKLIQAGSGNLVPRLHIVKQAHPVHLVRVKALSLCVLPAEAGYAAAVAEDDVRIGIAVAHGGDVADLAGGEVPAAHQAVVVDIGPADHGAEDQDKAVRHVLEAAGRRFRHGGTLGVVFQVDLRAAALIQFMPEIKIIVVAQGAAHDHIAVFRIDDAGQGDGDAVHGFLFPDARQGIQQRLPPRPGCGNPAAGENFHLFRHAGVLDVRAADVDCQNLHAAQNWVMAVLPVAASKSRMKSCTAPSMAGFFTKPSITAGDAVAEPMP